MPRVWVRVRSRCFTPPRDADAGVDVTDEGRAFAEAGSAEFRVWDAAGAGAKVADLESKLGGDIYKIGAWLGAGR
jgi:hypothetical protein